MLCLLSLISKYVSLVAYLTLLVALLLATFLLSGPKSNAAEMSSVIRRVRLPVFWNENTRLPSKRNIGGFVMLGQIRSFEIISHFMLSDMV